MAKTDRSPEYTRGYRVARSMWEQGQENTARRISERGETFAELYGEEFAAGFRKFLANH